ncbi:MAG: 3D domain protein [Candidatus Daviesbacteria bacterium GW2011_GWA2_38_24]|uniref:3D domain protein n=1 Tax=Candidatus Daviesbacteria bacterium GW2011_GWA2_38_24 TaxID=1618422 RepID=A0A0G0JH61_9BACT|nr:MAG: 3D domain protein [Candidatus Daviesbacteria bacterium GW2011_GWA2_38_24]KKQ79716.1 MAG: 3D domain protein [Candidatus Daviesbacteria bacterium GW2011_GWA1_38_7]
MVAVVLSACLIFSLGTRINFKTTQASEITQEQVLSIPQPIKTDSEFRTELETKQIKIERQIVYKDDPEMEIGEEKVIEEGSDGVKTQVIKTTYHLDKVYDQEVLSTEITPAKDKIIGKGTKIVWRTVNTPYGEIKYWRKMRVWATHYDSKCRGCDDWTAIGIRQGKGVIAVDPKVIKLRSKVYVPGYGLAVAGDTGGAIKGNIIDLGFEDAHTADWSARFVDIYLLN